MATSKKLQVPCELIVLHVLPRVRALIAKELVEGLGMSQVRVARLIGITQPAISQYLRKARSKTIRALENDPKVRKEISRIAQTAVDGGNVSLEICTLCSKLRRSKALCELHHSIAKVPKSCSLCKVIKCV